MVRWTGSGFYKLAELSFTRLVETLGLILFGCKLVLCNE